MLCPLGWYKAFIPVLVWLFLVLFFPIIIIFLNKYSVTYQKKKTKGHKWYFFLEFNLKQSRPQF